MKKNHFYIEKEAKKMHTIFPYCFFQSNITFLIIERFFCRLSHNIFGCSGRHVCPSKIFTYVPDVSGHVLRIMKHRSLFVTHEYSLDHLIL